MRGVGGFLAVRRHNVRAFNHASISGTDAHSSELRSLIARKAVAVITGAGFSQLISDDPVATWQGFLRYAVDQFRFLGLRTPEEWLTSAYQRIDSSDSKALMDVFEEIRAKLPSGDLERLLEDAFSHLPIKNPQPALALAAWDCTITTTNYDTLFERITKTESATWRRPAHAQEVLSGLKRGCLHLHGIFNDPETIVMSPDSYQALVNDPERQALLRGLRSLKALVFVGCGAGLSDPNFSSLFAWSRSALAGTHLRLYRLVRLQDMEATRHEHDDRDRVILLPYGTTYEDLTPFLWSLAPRPPITSRTHVLGLLGLLFLVTLGYGGMHWISARTFRVDGVVMWGNKPAGEMSILVPGQGPARVTDTYGYFSYEIGTGESVQSIDVGVKDAIHHFRMEPPITASCFLELYLETETYGVYPPR